MEAIEDINTNDKRKRIATIYTDSQVTIQSIKNYRNHKSLIEKNQEKSTRTGEERMDHTNYMDQGTCGTLWK